MPQFVSSTLFLPIIGSVLLLAVIIWVMVKRKARKQQSINWETMGLSRMAGVRSALKSKLNQKQREQLIWEALGSGDMDMMLRALDIPGYTPERHYILSSIVSVTYGMRDEDSEMRSLCEAIAWKHVEEFPRLARSLKANGRMKLGRSSLPRVNTFQYLATILAERGEFDKAVEICKKAITFGLSDGTKSGYEGRIKRIRLAQERQEEEYQV